MRNRLKIKALSFVVSFVFCISFSSPILADEHISALTEANIKAFIENTTDVTTSNSQDLSVEEMKAYLDKHLEDKAKFKSVMKYHIPNMPMQEATLALDKDGYMDSVTKGAESVEGYETLIEIEEIKVSSNGKKAFVKTSNTEYANMAIPTESGNFEEVPIEGVSECTQILSLNRGVIQMYSANCVTEVNFLEY